MVGQRVEYCRRMVLLGAEAADLLPLVNADGGSAFPDGPGPTAWGVGVTTLRRYFRLARRRLDRELEAARPHLLAQHVACRRQLYARQVAAALYGEARATLDSEAKLLGLFPAAGGKPADAPAADAPKADAGGIARPPVARPYTLDWLREFLGHFLTTPTFSRLHEDLAADLDALAGDRGGRRNYSAPRGNAKTTVGTTGHALWAACEGREPFVLILSETGPQACGFLEQIKTELVDNPALAATYPDACGEGPVWKADRIKLRNGTAIRAAGAGGRIRGIKNGPHRPTLVILDDPNELADAFSAAGRSHKLEWLKKDVMAVGGPHTNFVCLGTPIHEEAIVCELGRTGTWRTRTYRSIARYPDRMDLWAEWERKLTNLADPDRLQTARAFYEAGREALDAGAELLWPDREGLYALMTLRAEIGPAAFDCEKQDTPGTAGASEWPPATFDDLFFTEWPALRCRGQTLDPSKGTGDRPGDYQAHARGGVANDGTIFVEVDMRREDGAAMVAHAVRTAAEFRASLLEFEGNGTMGFLDAAFAEELARTGTLLAVAEHTSTEPKPTRIRRFGCYLTRRQVRIKDTPGGRLLVQQLKAFPTGEHDDGPDAAAALVRLLEDLVNGGR